MPASHARIRYLAINAIAWVVAVCVCLGVLAGARRVGMDWAKRQQSAALIASARSALHQGKTELAQDQLEEALSLAPSAWPDLARQLGW